MSELSKRILQALLVKTISTNKKESNAWVKEAQFKIHKLCRQSVQDAPRHLAGYPHQGGCFTWDASASVGNSHTSTSAGLMEIISSTEKLAVLVTHVSVSHKLCQGSSFCHILHLPSPMKKTVRFSWNLRTLQTPTTVKEI